MLAAGLSRSAMPADKHYDDSRGMRLRSGFVLMTSMGTDRANDEVE